ncbi:hypothetical protein QYZ88_018070 [Lachnospiraceae bacterium C1.1]|nr:hypothetical protein [Lachnospiraceae bacterium C1.1]
MFENLLGRIIASLGVVIRTFRAFFLRFLTSITSRVRSMVSITRHASKIGPKVLDAAASTGKKPSKREDYVETGNLLISKSFLITVAIGLVIAIILAVTVVWPWIVSHFLTRHMWEQDNLVGAYNGKVVLYYDKEKKNPKFRGKLEKGIRQGAGITYDENNMEVFNGVYLDGEYEGKGKLFKDGVPVYNGTFKAGVYDGEGTIYDDNGMILYEGGLADGVYEGEGSLYEMGELIYEGSFSKGKYSGHGIEYKRGIKVYDGKFEEGLYEGRGRLFDDGNMVYDGEFSMGKKSGQGIEYEKKKIKYKGDFEDDLYNGNGIAYNKDGTIAFKGEFVDGYYSGEGVLTLDDGEIVKGNFDHGTVVGDANCFKDDKLWYEGSLTDYIPDGNGKIFNNGVMIYNGPVTQGTINGYALTGLTLEDIVDAFQKKGRRKILEDGFMYYYPKLGANVFFSFATAEDEPRVSKFCLSGTGSKSDADLMIWKKVSDFKKYIKKHQDIYGEMKESTGYAVNPVKDEKEYYASFKGDSFKISFWCKDKNSRINTYEWEAVEEAEKTDDEAGEGEESVTDSAEAAQDKMNDLLEMIGLEAPGAADKDAGADAGAAGGAGGTDAGASGGADAGAAGGAGAGAAGGAGAGAAGGADAGAAGGAGAGAAAGTAAAGGAAGAGAAAGTAAAAGANATAGAATAAASSGAGEVTTAAATAASAGASAAVQTTPAKKSDYYGTEDPGKVIKKAKKKDRNTVIKNMILYFNAAERVDAAKQKSEMIEKSIQKANIDEALGEDTTDRVKELKKEANASQADLTLATSEMAKYASEISVLTGGDNGTSADMSKVAVFFDVSKIDPEKLSQAAVQNALTKNEEEHEAAMAAYKDAVKKNAKKLEKAFEDSGMDERIVIDDIDYELGEEHVRTSILYNELKEEIEDLLEQLFEIEKPENSEINDQEIYKLLQTQMIELQLSGETVKSSLSDYSDAIERQNEIEKKVKTGRMDEEKLDDAKMEVMEARQSLYSNLSSFTVIASEMNDVSGGYLSKSNGWMKDSFEGEE